MGKLKKGFTLVEILIVVVILGILAAIVIPQFTDASEQAREASLASDLQMMRSQIELYKIQHGGSLPDTNSLAEFDACFTEASDGYGPYMARIPENPYSNTDMGRIVTFVDVVPGEDITENLNAGWNMDPTTGEFHPTDAAHLTE